MINTKHDAALNRVKICNISNGLFTLPDLDKDSDSKPDATLYYAEVFTLHRVRFQS